MNLIDEKFLLKTRNSTKYEFDLVRNRKLQSKNPTKTKHLISILERHNFKFRKCKIFLDFQAKKQTIRKYDMGKLGLNSIAEYK